MILRVRKDMNMMLKHGVSYYEVGYECDTKTWCAWMSTVYITAHNYDVDELLPIWCGGHITAH